MELFQDMEGLVSNHAEILVENQDMGFFQSVEISLDMEIFLDLEAQHHTYYILKPFV